MSYEDIPEDRELSFPCDNCKNGDIVLDKKTKKYMCNSCLKIFSK